MVNWVDWHLVIGRGRVASYYLMSTSGATDPFGGLSFYFCLTSPTWANLEDYIMAVKKTTVATAVSVAKASKKAESSSTKVAVVEVTDWDKVLINAEDANATSTKDDKEYEFFNGKDRLVRTAPGWGSATGKQVKFVIYATDAEGNPLPELPPTRFGSLADVEYTEKRYPMSKGFFVNDQVCRNGRHRINVYRIHICRVVDKPVEVE